MVWVVRPGWRSMMTTFELVTAGSFEAAGWFDRRWLERSRQVCHAVKWTTRPGAWVHCPTRRSPRPWAGATWPRIIAEALAAIIVVKTVREIGLPIELKRTRQPRSARHIHLKP